MAVDPSRRGRFELVDGPLPPSTASAGEDPRRRARGPGVAITVVATVLLLAAVLLPYGSPRSTAPDPAPLPSSVLTPSPAPAPCDLAEEGCRVLLAARWRERTATVLRERLDPEDTYFTGYSYATGPPYLSGPRLNALGLDVHRLEGGGTEVFVQVARTRSDALRCGVLTRHPCTGMRFMDGNRFSLTTTTSAADGIEVQHIPAGTYVITVVARNTDGGRTLPLNTGDLIAVAQDPRLEPPPS